MPNSPWAAAQAIADDRCGLITAGEAAACGLTDDAVRRAYRAGRWIRLHRGVFGIRPFEPDDLVTALTAARLAARGGVVGGHSAARLLEVDGARPDLPELVIHPDDTREQRPGIRMSWRALETTDVVIHRGFPVTTPARTLLDLTRRESVRRTIPLVDNALRQGLLAPGDLQELAAKARRGAPAFLLADGRSESVFESEVRLDLTLSGLAPEVIQFDVRDDQRRWIARADFAWPSRRLLLELDGYATHGGPDALRADLRRQNALIEAGWTVLRFTWADRREVIPAVRNALRT